MHGCDKLKNMTQTNNTPAKPRLGSTVILTRQVDEKASRLSSKEKR